MARAVREKTSGAIEEYGGGCTPLLLFALLWLIADAARPTSGGGRLT
jgi:hypothetical protein